MNPNRKEGPCETCGREAVWEVVTDGFDDAAREFHGHANV